MGPRTPELIWYFVRVHTSVVEIIFEANHTFGLTSIKVNLAKAQLAILTLPLLPLLAITKIEMEINCPTDWPYFKHCM